MRVHYKFLFYHPYLTYSQNQTVGCFIQPNGEKQKALEHHGAHLSALWLLGKDAYSCIGIEDKESFDESLKNYFGLVDVYCAALKERNDVIFISAETGEKMEPDIDTLSDYEILSCIKNLFSSAGSLDRIAKELAPCFLCCCLKCIDDALIADALDTLEGAPYIIDATKAFCDFKTLETKEDVGKIERVKLATKGANARHAENRAIKESLREWYKKNKDKFSSKDKAAEEAIKQEPIAFRTARKWIVDFDKHPSAGRE